MMKKADKLIKVLKLLTLAGFIGFIYKKQFFYFFYSYCVAVVLQVLLSVFKKKEKGYSKYYSTIYLSLLNPLNLVQLMKQVFGQLYLMIKVRSSGIDPAKIALTVNYVLPFKGTWKIVNGGVTRATSHSWGLIPQRYAYDFCIYNRGDKAYKGDGRQLEDYYCFSEPIISPADGVVIEVKDSIRDYNKPGTLAIDWKTKDFRGNFIVIEHAEKEYSFIAHIRRNSIVVKPGDRVRQGQVIGYCGNSGHSTMPHIHFQLQDARSFWLAVGIPPVFKNIVIKDDMGLPVENTTGQISANEFVCNQ